MANNDLKIAIAFFSPTGNCKTIAEKIYSHFGQDAVLIDYTKKLYDRNTVPPCDLLFVVVPVYSQLCPAPIKKLLRNLQFKGTVVPCVSYGSVSPGIALKQVCKIFQKSGATIVAGAEFASPHSYIPIGIHTGESNLNSQTNDAAVPKLVAKAISRFHEKENLKKIHAQHFNPFALFVPKLRARIVVKLKCIDKKTCSVCLSCQNNCPFGAITKGLKVNSKCLRCGACAKNCKRNNKLLILSPIVRKYLKRFINNALGARIY